MDPREFLDALAGYTDQRRTSSASRTSRLATIAAGYTSGMPRVIFDGDTVSSGGGFAFLDSYTPVSGDRVLMLPAGNTYVILGKVVTS